MNDTMTRRRGRSCRFEARLGRGSVVVASGELDVVTAPTLAAVLAPLAALIGDVFIDLGRVTFIDAAGINVLCTAAREHGDRGRIVLCDPSPMTRRVIGITGLDQHVEVVESGLDRSLATAGPTERYIP